MGEINLIVTKIIFIYTFFPRLAYRSHPWMDFYARYLKDVKWRKDVPFGVIKLKFNIEPLFIPPKNRQNLAQNVFDRKRSTVKAPKSKLPLIIIVAP